MPTDIEWTRGDDGMAGFTFNPTLGCERVSPGCDRCYAIGVAHRGLSSAHRGLTVNTGERVDWTGEVRVLPERLNDPIFRRRKPARVFVGSMSDIMHPAVPFDFLAQLFARMGSAPQHTFMLLTKRPARARQLTRSREFIMAVDDHRGAPAGDFTWPLPNVWLGTSIEGPEYLWRARMLAEARAAVHFWSVEPYIEEIPEFAIALVAYRPEWVIVGAESGHGARPMPTRWARDLVGACHDFEVPVFVKQLSGPGGRAVHDIEQFPPELRAREYPCV